MEKFNINQKKRKRLREFQSDFTVKTKLREFKTRLVPLYPEVPRFNDSHKIVREYAEICPSTRISIFQERAIRRRIRARGLEKKYGFIVDEIISEIREDFVKITHAAGVNLKAIPLDDALRRSRPYDIKELDDVFTQYVTDAENSLTKFYYRVVEMVEADNTKLPGRAYQHLLGVCTGLMSVYISKAISQTIEHVIEVTASEELIPYLNLSLKCSDSLYLNPNENDIILIYTLFITKLIDTGINFQALETYRIRDYPEKCIHLSITENYMNESLEQIADNIINMFQPVNDYVNTLDDEFNEIFKNVEEENADEKLFSGGCQKIEHYQNYINKASSMLTSEYFAVGQLILSEYVISMKESLNEIIEGKYMIWVKTVHLIELRERIQEMLYNLTHLIEFGTISKDHMDLNAVTINWLENFEPILDQNSSMYEQIKYEYEERLQKTIAYVNKSIDDLVPMLGILDDMDDVARGREYVNKIKIYLVKIKELREKVIWINKEQLCLGFNVAPFKNVEDVENFVYPFFHLIKVCMNINRHINVWMDGQFEFLSYEETEEIVDEYMKDLLKMQKTYRIKLRQAQSESTGLRFFGVVDDPDLFSWPSPLKLTAMAIQTLKDFRPAMTIMRIMCNDALMKRHWKEMTLVAGFDLTPHAGTSLRKITLMGLDADMDKYDVISSGATKERELLRTLIKMQGEWADILFKTSVFKDTGLNILTALDDIQVVLDDHILKALTMRGSIFVKPYETEVRAFYDKLVRINGTIDVWGKVQSQWLYLLPIFSSKDIVAQMPEEGTLFKEVNDTYKRYIDVVMRDPRVFETAGAVGVLESMEYCCELLERINDGVTNYLEKKRLFFPRFFFLSNDEMLEILSETKDPLRVQPHLKKCFEAINTLDFDEKLQISAMYSQEGEKVNFKTLVNTKEAGGSVEKWLIQVEDQMALSVRDQILKSYKNYFLLARTQWVQKWPGQIVLAVSQMHWTYNVHKALNREEDMNIASYSRNSDRLVITPLTDRCYRTLIGAYHLHLNGAPEGPAGTGKTETTKDLAKALAVQCVVFNCSDGLDYKAMGKFFKGLASCGAWVCFDEFNRIDIEVLSVVAQQILSIVLAVRGHMPKFNFEGTEISLNPTCYVCITMNPGYAGRSELPDNLKVLFRTVAMMVPDYAMIGEISLYSYGFIDARNLSVKIVTVYRLCSEQLSSQNHYDYGMRAVKSVLSAAGNNKRKFPNENEDILLLRAILDVNLPKFLSHDLPLFDGIISDLFPGIVLPKADYRVLTTAMISCSIKRSLQPKESFLTKIIQTYEMMIVRHGFMLVGLPFAGKTSTLKVLADTLTLLNKQGHDEEKVVTLTLNPKAITMGQLYGQFDPVSYEWFDGVVATGFGILQWIHDNKKLCLMSGEVMSMTNSMSLIFEVMDLEQASPATVSRCGMIYLEPATLGWWPFIETWIPTCNPEWCDEDRKYNIMDLFNWLVPPCLNFIRKYCVQYCNPGEISLVKNMMMMVEMLLDDAMDGRIKKEEEAKYLDIWIQATFIQAGVWGLASILDINSRQAFDEFYKQIWRGELEDAPYPEFMEEKGAEISLPAEGLLFDYAYNYRLKGNWKYWPDIVRTERVDECKNILQALIPTVDTASFYIQDLLMNQMNKDKYEPAFITFTVQQTANQTQDLVISKLNKRKRGHYGPSKGKTTVLFIDDVNMPMKEVYGAQPPLELLRQYFDHKNWHFSIFSINEFSMDSMAKIFGNILLLGWKNNGFPSEIIAIVNQTVAASLDMFNAAMDNLRPTPSKSHYVFNLRDFSRLIQGCAMLRKESAESKKTFAKIWTHEVLRVFYDRLVEAQDKMWLYNKLRACVKDSFRENFEQAFEDLPRNAEDKRYEEVLDLQTFREMGEQCLSEYNATHKNKMDIILFDYALEHLSKICRVLSMSCGSALLVGISGSGRQSLTRLAAEIYGQTLFQPEITNNYTINDWRDDIKKILKEAGGRGKHSIFLITEGQIKEENFLQDVDCLLNSGEVPNIYAIDEKQEILDMVRLAAQGGNRNLDVSALEVFFFFTKRCKDRLHIILCFSPVGSTFRNRLRLFPALINCCTIDWFEDWPEQALAEVAHAWMEDVNLDEDVKNYSVVACKYFHVEARKSSDEFFRTLNRKTYITSASYLGLIRSFTDLTNKKQTEVMKAKKRYLGGLEKLYHAAVSIGEMQKSLADLQPQLKEMSAKAIEMTRQIEHETITVEKASAIVKEDEKVANKQAAAAQALKMESLDTLKPADITLVKSMKNPPDPVKLVMAAVCIIKDMKPDRKPDALLGDMNFLQSLKDFDKDNIKVDIMTKLRKEYIPHKDFKPSIVAKASSAAEGLCKWIIAMDMYDKINKVVAPKKAKLAAAEQEFANTMALLTEKRNLVQRLEAQLAILNEKLEEAMQKQMELQDNVDLCNDKLVRAQKLIDLFIGTPTLADLEVRKQDGQQLQEALQVQYDGLAGDILMSCGIISYLSPFNSMFRQRIVADWHKYVKALNIPTAEIYDMVLVLGSDVKIQNWYINGLPRDSFSTENGIIMDNSRRWSLFVDPQAQASSWIKKMEKLNNLEVVKFSFPDYMKRIEKCVQLGYPALVESIGEELEAPLDPLLFKSIFKQAGMQVISLGENVIEYHNNFRLYLTSKLRNPHYLPEVFNRVTIINFALTLEGLQDQLLGIVVAVEKPDLQQLKEELIVQKAENKRALQETEENILRTLSESKGDILEDEKAIQILDESKLLSAEIREKQERSFEIEKSIEEFRVKYQGVSEHSAVLYYCISDLANVDPMYQYSLDWFINLYIGSIQRAEKFRNIEKRCQSLINAFTFDLYGNITRSLFEKDKLLFSFLLCSKIMIAQQKLDEREFMFLLTGGVNVENPFENPCTSWLPTSSWNEICRVDDLASFKGFSSAFKRNEKAWKQIYDDFVEDFALPNPWNESINSFRRLIIVRMLRPDKLITCITNFVRLEMDERFIKPPPFNIAVSYDESYSLCPLIFILSPGTDPMSALVKFAETKKMTERFHSISLGQGKALLFFARNRSTFYKTEFFYRHHMYDSII
ncbi:hypothetical protein NQ314_016082, partial [Rhamnusium bicolor]